MSYDLISCTKVNRKNILIISNFLYIIVKNNQFDENEPPPKNPISLLDHTSILELTSPSTLKDSVIEQNRTVTDSIKEPTEFKGSATWSYKQPNLTNDLSSTETAPINTSISSIKSVARPPKPEFTTSFTANIRETAKATIPKRSPYEKPDDIKKIPIQTAPVSSSPYLNSKGLPKGKIHLKNSYLASTVIPSPTHFPADEIKDIENGETKQHVDKKKVDPPGNTLRRQFNSSVANNNALWRPFGSQTAIPISSFQAHFGPVKKNVKKKC